MVIHSTFPDFILFLYIHVAHIDNTYDPKELSLIKSKMQKLFPEGTDLEKKLYQAIREYNNFDRDKIAALCEATFEHFRGDKDTSTTRLFEDVEEIVKVDGKIHRVEQEILKKIKVMVDHQL